MESWFGDNFFDIRPRAQRFRRRNSLNMNQPSSLASTPALARADVFPALTFRPHLCGVLAGLFLSLGIACAALVLAGAWTRIAESAVVNLTGSARKNIRSDLAKVEGFLRSRGVTDYALAPVQFREITARGKRVGHDEAGTARLGAATAWRWGRRAWSLFLRRPARRRSR